MSTFTSKKRKNSRVSLLIFCIPIIFLLPVFSSGQSIERVVMFYNVENLFDTIDNPLTDDGEFIPHGERNWNSYRYYQKLNRISQVIAAAGQGNFPVVIGLCEVENQHVLEELLHFTPLKKLDYGIVHHESPDKRGIDVALLYRKEFITPLLYQAIPVKDPRDSSFTTRDILYVKGIMDADTIHFFVNHWPSKYGGVSATKPLRFLSASILREKTDSILASDPRSNIIVMGDFNDTPTDKSIYEVLGAKPVGVVSPSWLYNLAYPLSKQGKGTNKYRTKWDLIDQFIVSENLIAKGGLSAHPNAFRIFSPDFLLMKDENNLGKKLNRTFVGFKYNGGFSDHLPILLYLVSQ